MYLLYNRRFYESIWLSATANGWFTNSWFYKSTAGPGSTRSTWSTATNASSKLFPFLISSIYNWPEKIDSCCSIHTFTWTHTHTHTHNKQPTTYKKKQPINAKNIHKLIRAEKGKNLNFNHRTYLMFMKPHNKEKDWRKTLRNYLNKKCKEGKWREKTTKHFLIIKYVIDFENELKMVYFSWIWIRIEWKPLLDYCYNHWCDNYCYIILYFHIHVKSILCKMSLYSVRQLIYIVVYDNIECEP